jgi:antimicrobial peptide system SdpA family protein
MDSLHVYRARVLGAALAAIVSLWGSLAVYAFHSAIPFNAVRLPGERLVNIRYWSPQGWAFFTRDPQEDWLLFYRRGRDGSWTDAGLAPNGRVRHLFGFDRKPRAQLTEVAVLIQRVSRNGWASCRDALPQCFEQISVASELVNDLPSPTLCGSIGFAFQEQLPWAWSQAMPSIIMPARVAKVNVQCSQL